MRDREEGTFIVFLNYGENYSRCDPLRCMLSSRCSKDGDEACKIRQDLRVSGLRNLEVILNSRPSVKCGICNVQDGCSSSGISVSYFFVNVVLKWTVHNQLTTLVFVGLIVVT